MEVTLFGFHHICVSCALTSLLCTRLLCIWLARLELQRYARRYPVAGRVLSWQLFVGRTWFCRYTYCYLKQLVRDSYSWQWQASKFAGCWHRRLRTAVNLFQVIFRFYRLYSVAIKSRRLGAWCLHGVRRQSQNWGGFRRRRVSRSLESVRLSSSLRASWSVNWEKAFFKVRAPKEHGPYSFYPFALLFIIMLLSFQ